MAERIGTVYIEDEMTTSYIDYAMSVIVGRALPDVRDGLKPVHRRILYAMLGLGLTPDKPFKKCATVVGEVLGKYHPHGDMAVYDALVRLAQNFSMRYPLIQGQGNFGSVDGDPPAAYRYTESRLTSVAMEMLEDLDKDTVDFIPNFDGKLEEPIVLPSKFPQLLVNGSAGIAVGMATSIPPHNLGEIVDALLLLLSNPDAKDEEILNLVKGPDFPTGGIILNREDIKEAYRTGRGKVTLRGNIFIEEGTKQERRIVISEIPYQLNKSTLIERIARLVRDKRIEGISDIRDESDREGLRIVIELKKNAQEKVVLNKILHHTFLQTTFSIILLCLVDGQPRTLTLRELLQEFLLHRETITRRRTEYLLKKAERRAHILEGLKKALSHIDAIIALIKKSKEPREAREKLIIEFEFTEIQAQAILDMRLQQLTRLEQSKIEEEYLSLIKDIERYKSILEQRHLLIEELKREFMELKEKYADERLTKIMDEAPEDISEEDLIEKEKVLVTLTDSGYIKRISLASLRIARRGTIGRSGLNLYEKDFPKGLFASHSHDYVLFFSQKGKVFALKAYELPEGSFQSRGKPVHALLPLDKDDKVVDTISIHNFNRDEFVFFITKKGIVKKTNLFDFRNAGSRGIRAINLPSDDILVDVFPVKDGEEILITKEDGNAIRFNSSEIRSTGRNSYGVIGIKVKKSAVCSATKIVSGEMVVTCTRKGYGKRFDPEEVRKSHRGAAGVRIQRITKKTGKTIWLKSVRDTDTLVFMTKGGNINRIQVKDVKKLGRVSQGVILVRLREDDELIDVCSMPSEEEI